MARAHRLSGYDPDEDEEDEFLELQQRNPDELVIYTFIIHCKSVVYNNRYDAEAVYLVNQSCINTFDL